MEKSRQPATVLIADDHSMFAEALRRVLEDQFTVLGIVADGRQLIEEAVRLRPAVIVADIGMPLLNGFDAARQIWEQLPGMRVVFLPCRKIPVLPHRL